MPNTTIIQALQDVYLHWVSFDTCSVAYYDSRDQEPYIIGSEELAIDDISVGPNVKEIRFKKKDIALFIEYQQKYYIFQQNPFDVNQTTNNIPEFLDDPNLNYVFGQYNTILTLGTMAHETSS